MEQNLPKENIKVKFPEEETQEHGKQEEDTKQEDADILLREALKRRSQLIVESNANKKPWKK